MSTSENKTAATDNQGATVKPMKDFDATKDSERLHYFLQGSDEKAVVEIIPKRSNDQRQAIQAKFKDMYQQDLKKELESELSGDYEEIVLALLMTPAEYDAHCLHEAMASLGTNEKVLIEILATRSPKELAAIKEQYKKGFKTDLEKDIHGDTSGNFREMLLELLKGQRDQGLQVNMDEAREDAERLSENGMIAMVTKGARFLNILVKKNRAQVKATFEEYKKLYGHDIYHGITKATTGDDKEGYIGLAKAVEDPVSVYGEKFQECFAGKGTDDKQLIRIIVSRSEIDLEFIKVRYRELYKKTLTESVGKKCSGNYKAVLLAIIGDNDGIEERSRSAEVTSSEEISKKNSPEKNIAGEGKGVTVHVPNADTEGKNGAKFDENIKDDGKDNTGDDDEKGRVDESEDIEENRTEAKAKDEQNEDGTQKVKNGDQIYETDQVDGKDKDKKKKEKECKAAYKTEEQDNSSSEERNEKDSKHEAEHDNETTKEDEQGGAEENEAEKQSDRVEHIATYKDFDNHKNKKDNAKPATASDSKSEVNANAKVREDIVSDEDAKKKAHLVYPAKGPSDEEDIKILHHALYKDSPLSKETIVRLLSKRNLEERLNLRDKYNEYYKEDVVVAFQDRLSGNFQQLVVALVLEPEVRDAWQLRSALLSFGTDEVTIAHILCTKTHGDLQWIKTRYKDLYKKELIEDIKSDTSGSTRILLLAILSMTSSEYDQRREIKTITEEVMQKLWKPGMKATKETDDAIIEVVTSCSQNNLKEVSEKYKEMNGIDIIEGIRRSTKGDFQNCLLTLVMSNLDLTTYLVDVLSKVLKSFIMKDRALINIVLTCFEVHVDMAKIMENFQQINGKTLQTMVKYKCSGEYGKLMLELLQT